MLEGPAGVPERSPLVERARGKLFAKLLVSND
jgi:hypothetical protein